MSASNQQNAKNLLRQEQEEERQTVEDQSVAKETGAASVSLELGNSVITMKHGETQEVLLRFDAKEGDWSFIIRQIRTLVPEQDQDPGLGLSDRVRGGSEEEEKEQERPYVSVDERGVERVHGALVY